MAVSIPGVLVSLSSPIILTYPLQDVSQNGVCLLQCLPVGSYQIVFDVSGCHQLGYQSRVLFLYLLMLGDQHRVISFSMRDVLELCSLNHFVDGFLLDLGPGFWILNGVCITSAFQNSVGTIHQEFLGGSVIQSGFNMAQYVGNLVVGTLQVLYLKVEGVDPSMTHGVKIWCLHDVGQWVVVCPHGERLVHQVLSKLLRDGPF